ncbi:HD domain-containing protein [uncultured Duncaniella sp.]|uniref:HD domain-containing protein n=1 Tax=uncultured Duncaniella sp. TaxID=2768039 RepID=UPI0025A9B291|nr:HD domain-containing protein [uncultured Duncaniella sp.]
MSQSEDKKQRFCELLRSTGRENIEYVIEDLDTYGFFEAPASVRNHYNHPGGLVEHSLNVYDAAMMLREGVLKRRPDLEKSLPVDAVVLASLLHDVCKANIYRLVTRKRKNEIGVWEEVQEYEVNYSQLPIGHGEKSVVMLLRMGLDLEDDEICAIRWHMGPWAVDSASIEQDKSYRQSIMSSPLLPLIHTADTVASQIFERDETIR